MVTRFIIEDFNEDLLQHCVGFLNEYHPNNETDILEIIIESQGGYSYLAETLAYFFNQYNHVVLISEADSAAFEFVCLLKGPIKLFDHSSAMYHHNKIHAQLEAGSLTYMGKLQQYNGKTGKKRSEKYVLNMLNENEIKDIKDGKDVYFTSSRLKQIFKERLI